jgi:hypothetical protein
LVGWLVGRLVCLFVGWLVGWLVGRAFSWLPSYLICLFASQSIRQSVSQPVSSKFYILQKPYLSERLIFLTFSRLMTHIDVVPHR